MSGWDMTRGTLVSRASKSSAIAGFLFLAAAVESIAIEPYSEYRKLMEPVQEISALRDDLFGDSVSLYNGATSFHVVDVALKGSNSLLVQAGRRFRVDLQMSGGLEFNSNLEGAGGWDIDVPHISGMFAYGGWGDSRCSASMVPSVNPAFKLTEIWQGNTIQIPGQQDRIMLGIHNGAVQPSDGGIRKWTSNQRDVIDCIPMRSGLGGEGYRVTTTAGERYYFDVAVVRNSGKMRKTLGESSFAEVSRVKIYLLASRAEDRFGNWVSYEYNSRGNPVRISSNDGRDIRFSYDGGNLSSVIADGRMWKYGYMTVERRTFLKEVIQPDGSRWSYGYSNALMPDVEDWDGNSTSDCSEQPPAVGADFVLTSVHPSGASGKFNFFHRRHYRSGIHASECVRRIGRNNQYYYELNTPNFFDVMSLKEKSITGSGLGSGLIWVYGYDRYYYPLWGGGGQAASYPCLGCREETETVVVNPDGVRNMYRFGNLYAASEGVTLGERVLDLNGGVTRKVENEYMTYEQARKEAFSPLYGVIYSGNPLNMGRVLPLVGSRTVQDGVEFELINRNFDYLGRPGGVLPR